MTEVVSRGIHSFRWFGYLEHKSGDDWVSGRNLYWVLGRKVERLGRNEWAEAGRLGESV